AVGERIPSVREMGVTMGVNPNTVTRSYQTLQDGEIIDNRRGIGYFVAEKARERIMKELKTEFINDELPRLFRLMRKLDMGVEELVSLYEDYQGEDLA
ncbi:MAG: GntR family transcriptional regulator, partial [Spirochaetaceae bacterium]|nr:GntR family transcriptional regulator [Spirochaetaceae bacterium]